MSTSALSLALLGSLVAHGGIPRTQALQVDAAGVSAWTSHGLLDPQLRWVCEEIGGQALPTGFVRRGQGWWLSTTGGLLVSEEGCEWSMSERAPQELLVGVALDRREPQRVWVGSYGGLWAAEGEGEFVLAQPSELSLRSFAQREDGSCWLVGFDAQSQASAELEGQRVALPEASGRLDILLVDAAGRAYVRTQIGLRDRLYRVSEAGELEDLLGLSEPVLDVVEHGSELYLLTLSEGTRRSSDGGLSWSAPAGELLACLGTHGGELYGCPVDGIGVFATEGSGALDPAAWTWEVQARFGEVEALACGAETSFAAQCGPLWPTVEAELRDAEDEAEAESGGGGTLSPVEGACRVGEPKEGALLWCLGLLLLGLRRRESAAS